MHYFGYGLCVAPISRGALQGTILFVVELLVVVEDVVAVGRVLQDNGKYHLPTNPTLSHAS